ncbi:hypothetical protein AAU57_12075 [Nonlabens sp. YIK11]|uniref:hypothetical protein n=1 Tax=Nonlabens sp. YIK11 TaxID=1453349 RepID=UPI0006DBE1AA|nr:hypothetical protein [Nonlabens sp. YIK11]KQC33985.1 hypothetical protein AAU57_12075 [Nonlabens sp. YIK11]
MKEFRMTVAQVEKAAKKSRYLLMTIRGGYRFAINSGIVEKARLKAKVKKNHVTDYIGYRPIGLHEYISNKTPFI